MLALAIESKRAQLERAFGEAIFLDHAPIPATIRSASGPAYASRFGVYRNNVLSSLINALAARYPVVRRIVCDDAFTHLARLYIKAEPPRVPVLLQYGERFAQFLRKTGRSISADYVADVAELEAACTQAYHSANAAPL